MSEEIGEKVKSEQKNISTNEDLHEYGYKRNGTARNKKCWYNVKKFNERRKNRPKRNPGIRKEGDRKYYLKNKSKILIRNKKYREEHKEEIAEKKRKDYSANIENRRKNKKRYCFEHRDRIQQLKKESYWKDHDETLRKQREYTNNHREEISLRHKQYCKENKLQIKAQRQEYNRTRKGKDVQRRANAKRKRDLDYYPIAILKRNIVALPTVYHHLDNTNVIEMPEWIHLECSYPNREVHRERVMEKLKCFMSSEYYDVLDQDIFNRYANGEN